MKKILLIGLVLFGLTSCFKRTTEFLRSYVMYYNDAEEMILKESNDDRIYISFQKFTSLGDYKSEGKLKESYDALCEKHGDMTFLRDYVTWGLSGPDWTSNLGIDFVAIDITSGSDFNEEHPAESSLGNITTFSSYSLKPYIDSGYESKYNGRVYHPVVGLVSDMTPEQLILLGDSGYVGSLIFKTKPTLSKTHTFTVTMTADDGRVFTASIDMEFE